MASENSFDIVSKVDMQEVKNAVDQAVKEITARFDFKGSDSTIELDDKKNTIALATENEVRLKGLVDVLQSKLHKRGIDIRALELGDMEEAAKGTVKQTATLKQGLDSDTARKIVKLIKDKGLKVQATIQGDQVRVTGKSRDDLQTVMAAIKAAEMEVSVQYINYR